VLNGTLIGEGELDMRWVISGSFGPTDPTRAMLPFLFAASAVQAVDSVGRQDSGGSLPAQPLRRDRWARQRDSVGMPPCVEALGLAAGSLDRRVKPGGMNDFQAAAKGPEAKVVSLLRAVRTPRSNGAGHPAAQLPLLGHRAPRGRRQRPYGLFDW
jgi:tRNA 2-thiouridine synthesizing protein D